MINMKYFRLCLSDIVSIERPEEREREREKDEYCEL